MGDIDIIAQLADLKEIDYRNTLAIASIIEILIEKGIIKRQDIALKARELENMTISEIRKLRASR
ncbi:hypothetical protein H0A61_00946 [Koleobacter methoxysyntrophicus]|jgi:hypothetical protein|uniref:Uncharacterized protein n=1 Tax=Koleobacter methoxysyntrophicus TaxID=2751313 RepID=A0A8A0RK65_9FIRM|nr:hypothetical protein [Koleobacter methoxysyntrophicus]NPV43707.1 hypothetical protein [Bacillota bacterium]QSQ08613.1 hypothetical protein H0A61_00946 [Koleobacter methoxysyntrophicus]